ncbi:MAG: FMN-binding glutamate synthase family protein [Alicyclobacillaceae bacterium]|nr:FMN-binding glutamate synthase family protein [Alicyclobacillaceae bacterium]
MTTGTELILAAFAGSMLSLASTGVLATVFLRRIFNLVADRLLNTLLSDPYRHNLLEFIAATRRTGPLPLIENSLRAATGEVIKRPMGSPKTYPHFDFIGFTPAQVTRAATSGVVDLSAVIGPRASRPLHLSIPILIGGMGYGIGITREVWAALLGGAAAVGTVVNSGEGAVLLSDVEEAEGRFILQWSRAHWAKEPELLRRCCAVEIHFGQGASAGLGIHIPPEELKEARAHLRLGPRQWARIGEQFPGLRNTADLRRLVTHLRDLSAGAPVGAKIAPGDDIERCLETLLECGVDFITLDGSQAGTKGSEPLVEDDFGLPTFFALCRARHYLEKTGAGGVSLIVSGGLATPGHYLKALALGADAVAVGTPALYAVCHGQLAKTLPFEPPTELVLMTGRRTAHFDPVEGAHSLARYLKSCADEMALGVRALGKRTIAELGREDLFALDPEIARTAGVRYAGHPLEPAENERRSVKHRRSGPPTGMRTGRKRS